jgi:hypothetical protein
MVKEREGFSNASHCLPNRLHWWGKVWEFTLET